MTIMRSLWKCLIANLLAGISGFVEVMAAVWLLVVRGYAPLEPLLLLLTPIVSTWLITQGGFWVASAGLLWFAWRLAALLRSVPRG